MQDTTLLQYLSRKMHTCASSFSLSGELLFSYCGVPSMQALQESFLKDSDFMAFLLRDTDIVIQDTSEDSQPSNSMSQSDLEDSDFPEAIPHFNSENSRDALQPPHTKAPATAALTGPILKSLQQDYIFCCITGSDATYVLGPIRFAAPIHLRCNYDSGLPKWSAGSTSAANHTVNTNSVSAANYTGRTDNSSGASSIVPQVDFLTYMDDIVFFYQMITDVAVTSAQIIHDNLIHTDSAQETQKAFNSLLFENQENDVHHNSYDQELREQSSIENGDLLQLQKSWQEDYDGTIGTLAKDPLRNMKDLMIVIITLASRTAIRGGLSPEISFSLSDVYIQEIEDCSDIALLPTLGRNAELQYTSLVHELREQQKGILQKQNNPRINKCKDYIFSHLHSRITVTDLAREAGCSPNYLSQLFKQCEGTTISAYILQEKISRAKNLLIYSDYSYIEIASYLGFSSQSHLGQQFRKFTGCTLRQYREQNGNFTRQEYTSDSASQEKSSAAV